MDTAQQVTHTKSKQTKTIKSKFMDETEWVISICNDAERNMLESEKYFAVWN